MNNQVIIPSQGNSGVVTFTLSVNGMPLPTTLEVAGITVLKEVNRIPTAHLVILDGNPAKQDFEVSNEDWFVVGSELEVSLGNLNDEQPIFKGRIIKHQIIVRHHTAFLEIECRDIAYQMTLRRKGRYFENTTDSRLAEDILQEYSIGASVEMTNYQHPALVQHDVTDWDFLLMRMDFNGLLTIANDGQITIARPDFTQDPVLKLQYGSTVIEFDGALEVRDQFEAVKTLSWDYGAQEILEIQAEEPSIEVNGNLPGNEIAGANGMEASIHRHGGQIVADELQTWADARLLKDRLSRTCGRVQFRGFNEVKPGDIVELSGFGNRFNGPVYVAGVRQEFYDGSWLTDIEFGLSPKWFADIVKVEAPKAAGMTAAVHGLQYGVVTQIEEDPNNNFRIRVRLPIVDNEAAGVWARIATLDAGSNRGTFFLPEVNDEVIVGFVNDDPREAVVLGMVHSTNKAAPFTAAKENLEKGYVSREGMKLVFQEEEKSIVIETPGGNKLMISDDAKGLALSDQNGNSITMDNKGITIKSASAVNIKAENDYALDANSWKIKGKSLGNLEASGSLKLRGSMIDIN